MVPKMAPIRGNGGLNIRFYDRDLEKARVLRRILRQNPFSELQEPQKTKKKLAE